MWPWIKHYLKDLCILQGETQDCEVSLVVPCPKTCKNLWRSSVDHHSFFCSNRTVRSPKHNNSTVQSYKKLITQHLGLGHSKTERWVLPVRTYLRAYFCHEHWNDYFAFLFAVVQCASVLWGGWCGTQSCGGRFHPSTSKPRACPLDRPQTPPTGTMCRINHDVVFSAAVKHPSSPSFLFLKLCIIR